MRRRGLTGEASIRIPRTGILSAALLFWLAITGCHNTCVFFTSNPPTGKLQVKVDDARRTCTLSKANGTVRVLLGSAPMPSPAPPGLSSIQHLFITLRGIDAHPSTTADVDSPDWQELAPQLARHPVQVDLMATRPDPCAEGSLGQSDVPGGAYRQLRLRLVPNQPAVSEPVPEVNACGSAALNCIVRADDSIQPLVLDGSMPVLRIASEQIADGLLLILPDVGNDIAIEFNPYMSLVPATGDGVRLVPMLTAARRAACGISSQ